MSAAADCELAWQGSTVTLTTWQRLALRVTFDYGYEGRTESTLSRQYSHTHARGVHRGNATRTMALPRTGYPIPCRCPGHPLDRTPGEVVPFRRNS